MSAAEKQDVQAEIKAMLVNHQDSAEAVMAQLKDQIFAELVPDEQFRELILEVNEELADAVPTYREKSWFNRILAELLEFLKDTSRDNALVGHIMADDTLMDSLRENTRFKEQILGDLPDVHDLQTDELIGQLMTRYHANDRDARHFINSVQLNDPYVMQRRE